MPKHAQVLEREQSSSMCLSSVTNSPHAACVQLLCFSRICRHLSSIRVDLRIEIIRHFPRTANVKKSSNQRLAVEVNVCTARPPSGGKWFTAKFLHPKTSQSQVWEEILLFRTLSFINYRTLFNRNVNLKTIFSAKIEVSGRMKKNLAAASYHQRILSPKYGETGNVKPLSANRSLPFVVKLPNLYLKVCSLLLNRRTATWNLS